MKPAVFARFSHVGTWGGGGLCDVCGVPTGRLVEPLQIEWDEGTDRIGDFSWCGYTCVVVERVRELLSANGFEIAFGRVEVMPPTGRARRRRVAFPYHGPQLSWLIPTARLAIDLQRSGIGVRSDCASCGQKRYQFRRDGLFFSKESWHGEKMFLVEQFGRSAATFVTDEALEILKGAAFSNLCPRVAGHIDR